MPTRTTWSSSSRDGRAEVVGAVATIDETREALAGSPADLVFVDVELAATGDTRTGLESHPLDGRRAGSADVVLRPRRRSNSLEAFDLGVSTTSSNRSPRSRVEQCLRRLPRAAAAAAEHLEPASSRGGRRALSSSTPSDLGLRGGRRLTFVHAPEGRFDIDSVARAIEATFGRRLFPRASQLAGQPGLREGARARHGGAVVTVGSELGTEGRSVRAPVSQDRAKALRDVLPRERDRPFRKA